MFWPLPVALTKLSYPRTLAALPPGHVGPPRGCGAGPGPARYPRVPATHGAPPSSLPGDSGEAGQRWRERVVHSPPCGQLVKQATVLSHAGPAEAAPSQDPAGPFAPAHSGEGGRAGVLSRKSWLRPGGRVFRSLTPLIPDTLPCPTSLPVLGTGQVGAGRAFVGWVESPGRPSH